VRVVVALGGNALAPDGGLNDSVQNANVALAAEALVQLASEHELVITHGNGPQIGHLAFVQEDAEPVPGLDTLGAETEGLLGYALEQALASRLPAASLATLMTLVEISADDDAFRAPTKPIGLRYSEGPAHALAAARGWTIVRDGGGWRRVVASVRPLRILEEDAIRGLLERGSIVICAGGGGIPIIRDRSGRWHGADAVINKDATSALLAERIGADRLILATNVDAVYTDWGSSARAPIRRSDPQSLRARGFAPGSMGPKVEAACTFVERTGQPAVIGALADLGALLWCARGTVVLPTVAPAPARLP
jgi:carbamate kinase